MLKNINYGTITAGGDVYIGDKAYVIERDFPHSILFLRIEKAGEEYKAMLSMKGPGEASVPLLIEKARLPVDSDLFEQVDAFQDYRRGSGEALRLKGTLHTTSQTLESRLPTAIYQSFLTGDIGQVCTDFLSLLQAGKIHNLLLVVSTEEEAIQNLPWEMTLPLLTVGGSNTLPRDNFGLVRSREKTVQAFNLQGPVAEAAPIKLLFIPALPENLSERGKMLEIEEEQRKIIDAVRRLEATGNERPKLVMEILDCANLDEIKAALAVRKHDIVHISGHGQFVKTDKKGILIMENEDGDQQEVSGKELGLALREFSSIKLLVLSACETGMGGSEGSTAEQMAAVGVPAVLAMRFSVTDAGARLFSEKLYERLAYGDSLTKAMHDARVALWYDVQQCRANVPQKDIPAEWFTPVLYQNQVIGPLIKPEQYTVDTLNRFYPKPDFLRSKYTRLIGEGFIGRKRLLIQLRHHLSQGRHVCLHGLGGLGKTTTAEAFAHHYRQRYGYEVLLFSRGANIQEAIMLGKIFSRWKSRAQPAEDVAAELKTLLDSPDTKPEQKLQLLLDNCLAGRRTILILDNFEDVQKDADGIHQQAIVSKNLRDFICYMLQNSPPQCHVLFTTRYAITGLDGLVAHLEMDKLSYAEQYRYLNFSPILRRIPIGERDLLHQRFDGHPRALQFLEGLLTKDPSTDLPTLVQQAEGQIFEDLLLERIYDRLTLLERKVFTVASIFFSRSPLAALNVVLDEDTSALIPILNQLRSGSVCFWDEKDQTFEIHALTRSWMRKQSYPDPEQFEKISEQAGVFYWNQPLWVDLIPAKYYFEQAKSWDYYLQATFRWQEYNALNGFYAVAWNLSQEIISKGISIKANIHACNKLGLLRLKVGSYSDALFYFKQSLSTSQQHNDTINESLTLGHIGKVYEYQGYFKIALQSYEQALQIREDAKIDEDKEILIFDIGRIYLMHNEVSKALTILKSCNKIIRRKKHKIALGPVLDCIGIAYRKLGKHKIALRYLLRSLKVSTAVGDMYAGSITLHNIGRLYQTQKNYTVALNYYEESLKLSEQLGDLRSEGRTLGSISQIYGLQGDDLTSLKHLEKSLTILHRIGDKQGESITLQGIAEIYWKHTEYELALKYFEMSRIIRQDTGDLNGLAETMYSMAMLYFNQLHDYVNAIPILVNAYSIFKQINSPNIKMAESFLNDIRDKIGEERFTLIIQSNQPNSQS